MKIVTPAEMKEIDRKAIQGLGIPGAVLMENAGLGLFEIIQEESCPQDSSDGQEEFENLNELRVGIVCGKGNNGGDGFVLARHLLNSGAEVEIFLLGKVQEIKGDARINLNILLKSGYKITEITSKKDIATLKKHIHNEIGFLVDAIFGTGFKGKAKGIPSDVINIINDSDIPVLAVDVPSGLNAETGEVEGACVYADFTGTMCLPKRGLFLYPGKDYAGTVDVIDIGVPPHLWKHIKLGLLEPNEVCNLLPQRSDNSNKGTFGKVFAIAGSRGMTGAAALTGLSALKIGAGLVRLGIPESLNPILEAKATEVITVPLSETKDGTLGLGAMEKIMDEVNKATVLVMGPGLSTNPETRALVQELIPKINLPLVIDADGLNNLTPDILKKIKADTIITPHPGELAKLTGLSIQDIQKSRIEVAGRFAREFKVTLVLKGVPTIVASENGSYLNPMYNSALAKGGSGDVLTGVIGGLLAQGLTTLDASMLGIWLHGRAGELAREELTEYGVLASDVMELLPEAIKELVEESCGEEQS